jgi:hypothetical protein
LCPAVRYICVKELFDGLNPVGFEKGVFVILRGYMDEAKDPKTFNLTAVIATGHTCGSEASNPKHCDNSGSV